MSTEQPTPAESTRRAPWIHGDVPATVAYLLDAVADWVDNGRRRHMIRLGALGLGALAMLESIHADVGVDALELTDADKARLTVVVLDACSQAITISDAQPVKPPYGSPERAAHDAEAGEQE